jgi:hypothetical protein
LPSRSRAVIDFISNLHHLMPNDPASLRIQARDSGKEDWNLWGPYLSDRQWGTVREDYSADGDAWTSFPHDHARSQTYRWGEDGLLGISDNHGLLCFALARGEIGR